MTNVLIKGFLLLCVGALSDNEAAGMEFAVEHIMRDYSSVTMRLGSFMGQVSQHDGAEDLNEMSKALDWMASMMQGISGPTGAPPFVNEKIFMEIEQVFAKMGPYICLLPHTTPKQTEDLAPVLGGMIGGLIGTMVGEERLSNGQDSEDKLSLLSGLGTIAGAVGGMAGFEVIRGPYGMPNVSRILLAVTKFVSDMGDMKEMLHGSFEPLKEKQHKNLKLLVESDIAKALRKMSGFLHQASTMFEARQGEMKSEAFDTRFRGLDSEMVKCVKSVCAMAGIYGGITGYILPRYHEEIGNEQEYNRGDLAGRQETNRRMVAPGDSNAEKIAPLKKSLKMMRKGKALLKQGNLFGGIYDELAQSAGEIGGYSGVIGGMMAEVLASGAPSQIGKFLHWDLKEEDDDDQTGVRVSEDHILNKLKKAMPEDGMRRLSDDGKRCMKSVAVGLEHFGRLHKYGSMLPGSLEFKGPYGGEGDSVSSTAVERRLMASQWGGKWSRSPVKRKLNDSVPAAVLEGLIDKDSLEDNAVVTFINNNVKNYGLGSKPMLLLRGKLKFENAETEDIHTLSMEVLAALKPSVISAMSASSILDVFTSKMPSRNPERLNRFLMSVTDQQIKNALVIAIDRKKNNYWEISRTVATLVSDDLVERFGSEIFPKLCPFAFGISPTSIKAAPPSVLFDTDLLSCMQESNITVEQRKAIVAKAMQLEHITVDHIVKMKGFSDGFPAHVWKKLGIEDVIELINDGHFAAMDNMYPVKLKAIVNVIIDKLNISSSDASRSEYLRNLGYLICGIPPVKLKSLISTDMLEDLRTNWTEKCVIEQSEKNLEKETCKKKQDEERKQVCSPSFLDVGRTRADRMMSYNWTRPAVKDKLDTISGKLPLAVAEALDGLLASEIQDIQDHVFRNSLKVISRNNKLSMQQTRLILKKVLSAGHEIDTLAGLDELGNLVVALNISSVKASLLSDFLCNRPVLLQKFSPLRQSHILDKLLSTTDLKQLINSMTPFSDRIPTHKLRELAGYNFTATANMRWTQPQAMVIVEKYKAEKGKSNLTMQDIRELGRASIGLTCEDICDIPLFLSVDLARMIDNTLGDDITPHLASCIATKLHICLKLRCIKGANVNMLVGNIIPANIVLFLPPTILANVAYGRHCTEMISRLGRANIDLLSPGPGQFVIQGILQAAKICFYSNSRKNDVGDELNDDDDDYYNLDDEYYDDTTEDGYHDDNYYTDSDYYVSDHVADKGADDEVSQEGRGYKEKETPINARYVRTTGKLACSLQGFHHLFRNKAMTALGQSLPLCIGSITKSRKMQINELFMKRWMDVNELLDEASLQALAPFLLLLDPEFIKNKMTRDHVGSMIMNVPSMSAMRKRHGWKSIVGDKSTHTLTFKDNLLFEPAGTTAELVLDYNPVDFRAFADVVYPILKEYANHNYKNDFDYSDDYANDHSADYEYKENSGEEITTQDNSEITMEVGAASNVNTTTPPSESSRKKRAIVRQPKAKHHFSGGHSQIKLENSLHFRKQRQMDAFRLRKKRSVNRLSHGKRNDLKLSQKERLLTSPSLTERMTLEQLIQNKERREMKVLKGERVAAKFLKDEQAPIFDLPNAGAAASQLQERNLKMQSRKRIGIYLSRHRRDNDENTTLFPTTGTSTSSETSSTMVTSVSTSTTASTTSTHQTQTSTLSSVGDASQNQVEGNTVVSGQPDNAPSYQLLMMAGPAIIGMPAEDIELMSNKMFKNLFALMGENRGWKEAQLTIIKSKLSEFGDISSWSSATITEMGTLALSLNKSDLNRFDNLDLEALHALSVLEWPSTEHMEILLYRYLQLENKTISGLTGLELVALGDLLCGIKPVDISNLDDLAIKFSFASLGKRRCFDSTRLFAMQEKIEETLGLDVKSGSYLSELGIFAGAITSASFKAIPPKSASLISPIAMRLMPAANIQDRWNESHLALMGPENGAVMIARPDIVRHLSAKKKNAVFRAAFGSSAGLMSSLLSLMKNGEAESSNAFNSLLDQMMESVSKLYNHMLPNEEEDDASQWDDIWSPYGIMDPDLFFRPPPPEFGFGLSKDDFSSSFDLEFLEDDRLINFINDIAEASKKILDVMKGAMSFNDLHDYEIKEMPCTVFLGLKDEQIHEMSPKSIESMLDSERASRDPTAMAKVIGKLDTSQFEDAMGLLNDKMKANAFDASPWKPPIQTQQAMSKNYLKRLNTDETVSDAEAVDKFIDNICSMVAGLPANMIRKIPQVESKKKDVLDCMSESYMDLSPVQKKQVTKWAVGGPKKKDHGSGGMGLQLEDIIYLGEFLLDMPLFEVRKALSAPNAAVELVESGSIEHLDTLHPMFGKFSKMIMRKLVNGSRDKFDNKDFLDKLGPAKCEIPLKKVKKSMSKETMKYLANYTMTRCKDEETILEESLEQCRGEQSMRLQRCQLLQKQQSEKAEQSAFQAPNMNRIALDQFKMLRELASTLLEAIDLAIMGAEQMVAMAGALGGLTPTDMNKLPNSSVLDAMGTIKDNKNLSPKQKRIMLEKAKNAGFSLNNKTSLSDLGELVTEIPTDDLAKIPPENIKNNLNGLKKKAGDFSPSQKRAIVDKLQEGGVNNLLDQDLGGLASEVPLNKLDEIESVNLTKVKDQAWGRDQANKIINIHRNTSNTTKKLDAQTISELGTAVKGLNCSDIMGLKYYDVEEAMTTIDSNADMDPDMDECLQSKLHFSNQVVKGKDYLSNESDPDLETTLETIPQDVAVFIKPEVVNATPPVLCETLYQKIGDAQLNFLPSGSGDTKRIKLAEGAINCLKRDPDRNFTVLEEDDVIMLGKLICDVPADVYVNMTEAAFNVALECMHRCLHRFTKNHVSQLQTLVYTYFGGAQSWDETILASLGPLVSLMTAEDIQSIDEEYFAETYDETVPPKLSESLEVHPLVHYDAYYKKATQSLADVEAGKEEATPPEARRRKRQDDEAEDVEPRTIRTPTYDVIVSLGSGNSMWTVEELKRISNDDMLAALDTLGSVEDWSSAQKAALLERIDEALALRISSWSTSVVADAKHILTELTAAKISSLDISSLETTTSLSDVRWSRGQRTAAFDRFMALKRKTAEDLTAQDLAGLGNIFCGMDDNNMFSLPGQVISDALKDLGKVVCYSRDQLDVLYSLVELRSGQPDGALLRAMGSIAAGMQTEDLRLISVPNMPLLSLGAIQLMDPLRFKNAMSEAQLGGAGITNVAAIIARESLYNALTVQQRNRLQIAAYGDDAVLEFEAADPDEESVTVEVFGEAAWSSNGVNWIGGKVVGGGGRGDWEQFNLPEEEGVNSENYPWLHQNSENEVQQIAPYPTSGGTDDFNRNGVTFGQLPETTSDSTILSTPSFCFLFFFCGLLNLIL